MTILHLLTTRQVSEKLGISIPTLNRWVREGRITPAAEGEGVRGARWFEEDQVLELAKELGIAS